MNPESIVLILMWKDEDAGFKIKKKIQLSINTVTLGTRAPAVTSPLFTFKGSGTNWCSFSRCKYSESNSKTLDAINTWRRKNPPTSDYITRQSFSKLSRINLLQMSKEGTDTTNSINGLMITLEKAWILDTLNFSSCIRKKIGMVNTIFQAKFLKYRAGKRHKKKSRKKTLNS